jgi:hypothetical protein
MKDDAESDQEENEGGKWSFIFDSLNHRHICALVRACTLTLSSWTLSNSARTALLSAIAYIIL